MSNKQTDNGGPIAASLATKRQVDMRTWTEDVVHAKGGLSHLDWFAGMALQGICSNLHCTPSVTFDEVSERAYQQAESMVKAMNKRKSNE